MDGRARKDSAISFTNVVSIFKVLPIGSSGISLYLWHAVESILKELWLQKSKRAISNDDLWKNYYGWGVKKESSNFIY